MNSIQKIIQTIKPDLIFCSHQETEIRKEVSFGILCTPLRQALYILTIVSTAAFLEHMIIEALQAREGYKGYMYLHYIS